MANSTYSCRTNYFLVKDRKKFDEWASQYPVRVIEKGCKEGTMVGLLGEDPDGAGWPSYHFDDDEEIDFSAELSEHLREGQIAVLMEAGAEKLRYITGVAIAIDHNGTWCAVNLDDIYRLAEEKLGVPGHSITRAMY